MKNLNSLLVRLGALSLAAAMTFSVAEAATGRKDPKAAAAVIEALVHKVAANDEATKAKVVTAGATVTTIDTPLVVGKRDGKERDLLVYGDLRAGGDIAAGEVGTLQLKDGKPVQDDLGNYIYKTPGRKHIIGTASLDPHTQQFRIVFKDKTATSHGAFVNLDFVTTATGHFGDYATTQGNSFPSGKKALVGIQLRNFFVHPQLKANQMMTGPVAGFLDATPAATADGSAVCVSGVTPGVDSQLVSSFIMNGYNDGTNPVALGDLADLSLAAMIRLEESTTNNVNFGFVPAAYSYNIADADGVTASTAAHAADTVAAIGNGFYDAGWMNGSTRTDYIKYDVGTISYQVASDNAVSAAVVTAVVNGELLPADVFELFSEEELGTLLEILKDYFGEDVVKMREYLIAHRHQLSRAFKAVR